MTMYNDRKFLIKTSKTWKIKNLKQRALNIETENTQKYINKEESKLDYSVIINDFDFAQGQG